MLIRVAICEDEQRTHQILKKGIDNFVRKRNLDVVYMDYYTGSDLLANRKEYDIVFMDYDLGKENQTDGLQIAQKIRETNREVAIIFFSSFPAVIFPSFEVNTFRFLVKPLNEEKLFEALDGYLRSIEIDEVLLVRIDGVTFRINTSQITYLEGNGKYCKIHTLQEIYDINETMASVEARLPSEHFARCHRSFLIHLKYVVSYSAIEIGLETGEQITASRSKYKGFHEVYVNYVKRFGG